MIEVKTVMGRTNLKMRGTLDVICTDVTMILRHIHEALDSDAKRELFRERVKEDTQEGGLAWLSYEQLDERFDKLVRESLTKAMREIFGSDCQKAETDAKKPQAEPSECDPELAKLFADIRAAEEVFRGRRGQTDESRS